MKVDSASARTCSASPSKRMVEGVSLPSGDSPIQGQHRNTECLCDVSWRRTGFEELLSCLELSLSHCSRAPACATSSTSSVESSVGALGDELSLHLSQRRHEVEEEPAHRRRCVDRVGEALKLDVLVLELIDKFEKALRERQRRSNLGSVAIGPNRALDVKKVTRRPQQDTNGETEQTKKPRER